MLEVSLPQSRRQAQSSLSCPAWIVSWIIHNLVAEKEPLRSQAMSLRLRGVQFVQVIQIVQNVLNGLSVVNSVGIRAHPAHDERRSRDCRTVGRWPDWISSRRRV